MAVQTEGDIGSMGSGTSGVISGERDASNEQAAATASPAAAFASFVDSFGDGAGEHLGTQEHGVYST